MAIGPRCKDWQRDAFHIGPVWQALHKCGGIDDVVDTALCQEGGYLREQIRPHEEDGLPKIPHPLPVDKSGVHILLAVSAYLRPPDEHVKPIDEGAIFAVHIPGDQEPGPPDSTDSFTHQSQRRPASHFVPPLEILETISAHQSKRGSGVKVNDTFLVRPPKVLRTERGSSPAR